jgi:leader peptidase (prepilin peptidase) / N-methyltransferase
VLTETIEALHPAVRAALGGSIGAIVGSYMGALVLRWPNGEATVGGRSRCDNCKHQLAWYELIPLLSFFILQGKCRSCNARIDRAQPLSEWLGAFVCGLAFYLLPLAEAVAWSLLALLLLPLALLDARHYWLPDRLLFLLALLGLAMGSYTSDGASLPMRLIGAVAAFALLELVRRLFRLLRNRDGMGAGDPKLFAAIALWTPPLDLPFLVLIAAALGLVVALVGAVRGDGAKMLPLGTMMATAVMLWGVFQQFC